MEKSDKSYLKELTAIKEQIQASEILQQYLDEEEEELYKSLQQQFEPAIEALHQRVAAQNPLQLIDFESHLLDPGFEGLFLPRILGYSVLRGEINSIYKYLLPQNHFKNVLLSICNSLNFDMLKLRIGQTIQIGFALSSEIWITNLYNNLTNKKVIQFLDSLRLEKFRDIRSRHTEYLKYKRQFHNFNFLTTDFPKSKAQLSSVAPGLKSFLVYRSNSSFENTSLDKYLSDFISEDALIGTSDYLEILMIISMFFDLDASTRKKAVDKLEKLPSIYPDFETKYFRILNNFHDNSEVVIKAAEDNRMSALIKNQKLGEITRYYDLMDKVHSYGYVHDKAIEAVQYYYDQHEGLSVHNECVRKVVFSYFSDFLTNIDVDAYQDYFELNRVFIMYMNIFDNEKFNQNVKRLSLLYIKKLIKTFTDKRAKDYQDIKKFVKTTFLDLGFMKPKELVELFKTKRKKKPE